MAKCTVCQGTGYVYDKGTKDDCPECDGTGEVEV